MITTKTRAVFHNPAVTCKKYAFRANFSIIFYFFMKKKAGRQFTLACLAPNLGLFDDLCTLKF